MALKKKLKTRLDLIQEAKDNGVYVVEDEKGKKVSNTSKSPSGRNVYTKGAQSTLNDIAPVRTTTSWKNNITKLPLAEPSDRDNIMKLPLAEPDAGNNIVKLNEFNAPSLLDKTSITDKILGINGGNASSLTGNSATSIKQEETKMQTKNDTLTRPQAGITDEKGYTTTGLVYGDYWYQNYAKDKNNPIVEKDGKYYISKGNGIYHAVDTMSFMTTKEQSEKDYKAAVEQGYTGGKNDVSKIANQIKLDSSNLTAKEKEEYAKDLKRQEKDAEEELARKNEVHYGGAGIKGAIGEVKTAIGNITETVDDEVIEPIRDAKDNWNAGKMTESLGMEAYKKMIGEENNYDELKKEYDNFVKFNEDIVNEGNYLDQTIQTMPNQLGSTISGIKSAGPLGAIGAIPGAILGAVTTKTPQGALAGATTGAKWLGGAGYVKGTAEYTYKLEAGLQYQTLIEMGIPEDIAKKEAKDTGLANALIEGGESIVDLVSFGQLSKVKTVFTRKLAEKYGEDLVSNWVGKTVLKNALSEGIEEGTQEIVSIHNEKQAMEQAGLERDDSQDFERIKESTISGAFAGLIMSAGTSVVSGGVKTGVDAVKSNINDKNATNKQLTTEQVNQAIANEIEKGNYDLTTEEIQQIQAELQSELQKEGVTIVDSQSNINLEKNDNLEYNNVGDMNEERNTFTMGGNDRRGEGRVFSLRSDSSKIEEETVRREGETRKLNRQEYNQFEERAKATRKTILTETDNKITTEVKERLGKEVVFFTLCRKFSYVEKSKKKLYN